jgi:hypothetical protein
VAESGLGWQELSLRAWLCAVLVSFAAFGAAAETVVLRAVERGVFREDGSWELGPEAPNGAGRGPLGEERGVVVFDTAPVRGTVRAVQLRLGLADLASPDRDELLRIYAVSSDPDRLVWEASPGAEGTIPPRPAAGTFRDLGSGVALATAKVSRHRKSVVVPLDREILRVLERAGGRVAFGLCVESLGETPRGEEQVILSEAELLVTVGGRDISGPRTLHVDASSPSAHADGSEARPFPTPSAALDLATPGDRIAIAPGHYADTLVLKRGVEVRGSGADRTWLELGRELPSVRCADSLLASVFVVRTPPPRGSFPAPPPPPALFGEAIDCTNGASQALAEITVWGAGIRLERSDATVRASEIGGGIEGIDSAPEVSASELGSGIRLGFAGAGSGAPFVVERNRIIGGLTTSGAAPPENRVLGNLFQPVPLVLASPHGGMSVRGSGTFLIAGNTFYRTSGLTICQPPALPPFPGPLPLPPPRGSGPSCEADAPGAIATIANNLLVRGAQGILLATNASATIVSNDVFGNGSIPFNPGAGNYVGLPDRTGIDGNLSENPRFLPGGDFRLGPDSPALDAGANLFAATAFDLDGDPRVVAAAGGAALVDIGAQEHQPAEGFPLTASIRIRGRPEVPFGHLNGWESFDFGAPIRVDVLTPGGSGFDVPATPGLVAPVDLEEGSLRLEGAQPLEPCAPADVDEDGDEDLACVFPYAAVEKLPALVTKRLCVTAVTRQGEDVSACGGVRVLAFMLPVGG